MAVKHEDKVRIERVRVKESWEEFIFEASEGNVTGTQSLCKGVKAITMKMGPRTKSKPDMKTEMRKQQGK